MNHNEVSKYISLLLRHRPEVIGIQLDSYGWADVNELIIGIQREYPDFSKEVLDTIVKNDNKQRYSYNIENTKIRANQGHSININLGLQPVPPPSILYHGSCMKYETSIDCEGLLKKSRQYVHLSSDIDTAKSVGMRHGKPVIYVVESRKMFEDGYEFYLSENGVWLTESVPREYLVKNE